MNNFWITTGAAFIALVLSLLLGFFEPAMLGTFIGMVWGAGIVTLFNWWDEG